MARQRKQKEKKHQQQKSSFFRLYHNHIMVAAAIVFTGTIIRQTHSTMLPFLYVLAVYLISGAVSGGLFWFLADKKYENLYLKFGWAAGSTVTFLIWLANLLTASEKTEVFTIPVTEFYYSGKHNDIPTVQIPYKDLDLEIKYSHLEEEDIKKEPVKAILTMRKGGLGIYIIEKKELGF